MPEADEVLPAPLPPYRVLTGLVDRFGRTQTFHREAAGEFSGEITGVTDGAGRHFRLVLTTQAQRAEEARQQAISGGTEPSAFPDTLPGYTEYGRDNGIRLSAVWLPPAAIRLHACWRCISLHHASGRRITCRRVRLNLSMLN